MQCRYPQLARVRYLEAVAPADKDKDTPTPPGNRCLAVTGIVPAQQSLSCATLALHASCSCFAGKGNITRPDSLHAACWQAQCATVVLVIQVARVHCEDRLGST